MKAVQLIGIGSPFSWDRVAWMVLKTIQYNPVIKNLIIKNKLQFSLLDRPNVQLLEHLYPEKINIIIDAVLLDAPFGENIQTKVDNGFITQLQKLLQPGYSTHGINLADTLTLGFTLNKLPQKLYFFGFNISNDIHCIHPIAKLHLFKRKIIRFLQDTI